MYSTAADSFFGNSLLWRISDIFIVFNIHPQIPGILTMGTFEKNYHSTYRIPNFVGFKNFEILQTEESDQKKVVDAPFSFWGHPQASKTQQLWFWSLWMALFCFWSLWIPWGHPQASKMKKPGSKDCSGGIVSVSALTIWRQRQHGGSPIALAVAAALYDTRKYGLHGYCLVLLDRQNDVEWSQVWQTEWQNDEITKAQTELRISLTTKIVV